MTALSERLLERYYGTQEHPYRTFEAEVAKFVSPTSTLLDAGCGRTAPILVKYRGRARRLIGIDAVQFAEELPGMELYRSDLACTGLPEACVDVLMARSVMEHIVDPQAVYREFARVLRPGGRLVFLTANLWDYASLIAAVVPNRLHARIVARTEGRSTQDTFPTAYRTNTRRAIQRLARGSGFRIERLSYLSQYPGYFMFNGALFWLATGYEKLIAAVPQLAGLRGWILCTLVREPLQSRQTAAAAASASSLIRAP